MFYFCNIKIKASLKKNPVKGLGESRGPGIVSKMRWSKYPSYVSLKSAEGRDELCAFSFLVMTSAVCDSREDDINQKATVLTIRCQKWPIPHCWD